MSHIDSDGELILDTVDELVTFIVSTDCPICAEEGREVLAAFEGHQLLKLVFSVECHH